MLMCQFWKNATRSTKTSTNHLRFATHIFVSFLVFLYCYDYSLNWIWLFILTGSICCCWRDNDYYLKWKFVSCVKVAASPPCPWLTALALSFVGLHWSTLTASCRKVRTRLCCWYQLRSAFYSANRCNYTTSHRQCSSRRRCSGLRAKCRNGD